LEREIFLPTSLDLKMHLRERAKAVEPKGEGALLSALGSQG
jgi:hypothetical protein